MDKLGIPAIMNTSSVIDNFQIYADAHILCLLINWVTFNGFNSNVSWGVESCNTEDTFV